MNQLLVKKNFLVSLPRDGDVYQKAFVPVELNKELLSLLEGGVLISLVDGSLNQLFNVVAGSQCLNHISC